MTLPVKMRFARAFDYFGLHWIITAALALAVFAAPKPAAAQFGDFAPQGQVHVLHVQGNVYMIVGAGANIAVQAGDDGVLLVDTGTAAMSQQVLAAIRSISDKPIRYIVNTSADPDHVGGNEVIAPAGSTIAGGNVVGDIGASAGNQAAVIAFQSVLDRMSAPTGEKAPFPQGAWPTDTFTTAEKKLYFNGEPIEIIHIQNGHTDGDSIVFFQKSDVVAAGDIFVTTSYPVVELDKGGSINGLIAGLNRIIQITTPISMQEGGTMVIPGHGRVCDQADVKFYQEAVTIVRDRMQDAIKRGLTLPQVETANLTLDYDPRYGATEGPWTTKMFVDAVFKSLSEKHEETTSP
ncbi:MAG: MBL fold metallo-hydrolase [Acidobacteriota bacterium]|nr:MBL fold metallo-hydrolase [Acidobacteriota bacterium]